MSRAERIAIAIAITCGLGCGSDSSGKRDAGKAGDATAADSRPIDTAANVIMDGPPGTTPLAVKNYLSWCSVTVGSGSASSGPEQLVNVMPGVIALSATPLSGYELGAAPWHDTDGDTGSGDPGTVVDGASTTTITVAATAKCVWVCCEMIGENDCSLMDICP
ncbi:MAG TPA: hypothetical protein VMJ10_24100 [Kofleriaceae bacterium]|nr:hypothetical protein [Kofleriaceae bacterium]